MLHLKFISFSAANLVDAALEAVQYSSNVHESKPWSPHSFNANSHHLLPCSAIKQSQSRFLTYCMRFWSAVGQSVVEERSVKGLFFLV